MANNETVKGFKDITGKDALKREKAREIIIRNFKLYGFEPAETPTIEYEEFVKGTGESNENSESTEESGESGQDEAVSDIFKLQDRGERKLALRYEFTFQLKRIVEGKKLPYKRFQIGSVFRDEPTKPGRFREFTQCDADIIGGSELAADAEVLALARGIFSEFEIPEQILVNNRQLLSAIIEKVGVRDKATEANLIREIDKMDKNMEEAYANISKTLGEEKAKELLDYFNKDLKFFIEGGFPGANELVELEKLCRIYGFKIIFRPNLARGLSYYTGNIFEITSPKYNFTLSAGGRYMIKGLPCVGISFGLDRITEVMKDVDVDTTKCLVISINQDKEAIVLANDLRMRGISSSLMYGKPSKALEYANSYNIPYVIFIGEVEVLKKKYKLKDMKTGKEEFLGEDDIVGLIRKESDKTL